MNADILKGKWRELKGEVKTRWGKLTDDELSQIEGKEEKLLGFIQSRYGYSKDEAEKEYNDFLSKFTMASKSHPGKKVT